MTEARRAEQKAMEAYGNDGRCLMEALRIELDDPGAEPCGRCSVCTEPQFDGELDRELSLGRSRWSATARSRSSRARASRPRAAASPGSPARSSSQPGRALSLLERRRLGAAGRARASSRTSASTTSWSRPPRPCIWSWEPDPAPTWVTAVPSLRRPELVPDFAERLAEALEPALRAAVAQTPETREQNQMTNSRQQYLNVEGAFAVDRAACDPGAGPADRRHRRLEVDPDRGRAGACAGPASSRSGRWCWRARRSPGSRPPGIESAAVSRTAAKLLLLSSLAWAATGCGGVAQESAAGSFEPGTAGTLTVATAELPTPGFWEGRPAEPERRASSTGWRRRAAERFGLDRLDVVTVPFSRDRRRRSRRRRPGDGADHPDRRARRGARLLRPLPVSSPPALLVRAGTEVPDVETAQELTLGG